MTDKNALNDLVSRVMETVVVDAMGNMLQEAVECVCRANALFEQVRDITGVREDMRSFAEETAALLAPIIVTMGEAAKSRADAIEEQITADDDTPIIHLGPDDTAETIQQKIAATLAQRGASRHA